MMFADDPLLILRSLRSLSQKAAEETLQLVEMLLLRKKISSSLSSSFSDSIYELLIMKYTHTHTLTLFRV